jgi:hypothetical protein
MFKSYLKTALRKIKSQKAFGVINIVGLGVGVAAAVIIYLFIDYELGFDANLKNNDHLYRVVLHAQTPTGVEYTGANYFPLSTALRNDFRELRAVTQTNLLREAAVEVDNETFKAGNVLFVEPDFYTLIKPRWIEEDRNRGRDPASVILTESQSKKYFGTVQSVGKRLTLLDSVTFTVTGIVADPPEKTSLPYDMLLSWKAMDHLYDRDYMTRWNYLSGTSQTFVQLPESRSKADFERMLDSFKRKYLDEEDHETVSFHLQPAGEMHLDSRYATYTHTTAVWTLWVLGAAGFLILLIGCVNFINLTTAWAMKRAREMGMRKVLGADRKMLIQQMLGETSFFIAISLLLGVFGAAKAAPFLSAKLGIAIETGRLISVHSLAFFSALFLFLVGVNGFYPALVLSRCRPVDAFKSSGFSTRKKSAGMRNGLVFFQFAVTQILIIASLIVASQSRFIAEKDLGFRKDGIVIVDCPSYDETANEGLRAQWLQNPRVRDVSFAYQPPAGSNNFNTTLQYPQGGDDTEYRIVMKLCDSHYLDVYDIPLLAGSFHTQNTGNDERPEWVINQDVLKKTGIASPEEAIGKIVRINGISAPVIGVVKDFHTLSLHEKINPAVLANIYSGNNTNAHIMIDGQDLAGTMKYIRRTWEETFPGEVFEFSFLDEQLAASYESTYRTLTLTGIATVIAICLGCLGLLGLAAFVLVQKTKEICVRKILGASVESLYLHVVKYFLTWIIAANLVSWPVAWWLTREWLEGFAYRVTPGIGVYLAGSALVGVVALAVISFHVLKAVRINPAEALRYT